MKTLTEKFEKDLQVAISNAVENLKGSLDDWDSEEKEIAVEVGAFPLDYWVDNLKIEDYVQQEESDEAFDEYLAWLKDMPQYEALSELKLEYSQGDVYIEFEEYLKKEGIKFERCEGEFYAFEGRFHNISSECLVYIYSK